jgi:hypothetical protein
MQEGDVVAFAKVTLVCVKAGAPCPIPDEQREFAEPWMLRT